MTDRFVIEETPLAGLKVLQRNYVGDTRGFFERLFCSSDLEPLMKHRRIAQINQSLTHDVGAVRGMHFQYPPYAEMKIVTCTKGELFDVAVDVRSSSPTFLQWYGIRLSEENHTSLLIPEGFAHGFQVLRPDSQILYFHSAPYHRDAEGALNALDPRVAIRWPLAVGSRSDRDAQHPMLEDSFPGIPVSPDAGVIGY